MSIVLGCIADDFTGAGDLAGLLARSGVAVILRLGVPPDGDAAADEGAVAPFEVVALKCRTAPVDEAVAEVRAAWRWLAARGARRCYWKYCSTFDSTSEGNIGPVADALLDELGASPRVTVHAPSFPENGRTVYQGRLFVGDVPLDESPMRDHPLTPMRDSDLARLLAPQTDSPVAKLPLATVRAGREAVVGAIAARAADGAVHLVADAIEDQDLVTLVRGTESLPLLCGGSAFASHVPGLARVRGHLPGGAPAAARPRAAGRRLALAGSCSAATRAQIDAWPSGWPSLRLDAATLDDDAVLGRARDWLGDALGGEAPVLVYSSATPDEVRAAQARLGTARAGELVEAALGALAVHGVGLGVGQLVTAGGESSGAVARALGIERLGVGAEIAPGVPWCVARRDGAELAMAMKSGNFGGPGFFAEAFERLAAPPADGPADEPPATAPG